MSRIAEVRKANGYTQAKLAKHLGVGRSTVSMWESSSQEPDSETLGRIADLFDVTVDYLLERTDDPSPAPALPQEAAREVLAGDGVRILLDADANLTDDQLSEIVEFIKFKRRTENR